MWWLFKVNRLFSFFTCSFFLLLVCFQSYAVDRNFESPRKAYIKAQKLVATDAKQARLFLKDAVAQYPKDTLLLSLYARHLFDVGLMGEAEQVARDVLEEDYNEELAALLDQIEMELAKLTASKNMSMVTVEKHIRTGDYVTALALAVLATGKWPQDDGLYYLKGQALYGLDELDRAEIAYRIALGINPQNLAAKTKIEAIRTTESAQTSEELAEWIGIAKDKVGDFIVTFLALFTAFITNSLIAPVILHYKLNRSRRSFERGQYDDFTDLMEALLDQEQFSPIRTNFQFLLKQRTYDEAKEILNSYVNTVERLPTLLRILEREYEKKLEAT
ncbi:MAG: tetratricopeptide repeat protein [bacterium]|nr:tetratricopeptide repeat protein [Gammaproteobacteria bacterium]